MSIKDIIKTIVPESVRTSVRTTLCRLGMIASHLRYLIQGKRIEDPKQVPIIINNYNRLFFLKELIASLESRGYTNIHIIDNASSYEPLLRYYDECPYRVYRLTENIGYLAIWETGIYKEFQSSFYVYTDSDMRIDDACPDDFMQRFMTLMQKYPMAQKVGFGIRIDDLPDRFRNKADVIEHESKFWKRMVEKDVYDAEIDTTFALYRPFCKGKADKCQKVYRTGGVYVIRHLPWYTDSANMTDEEKYYVASITRSTHWSQKS